MIPSKRNVRKKRCVKSHRELLGETIIFFCISFPPFPSFFFKYFLKIIIIIIIISCCFCHCCHSFLLFLLSLLRSLRFTGPFFSRNTALPQQRLELMHYFYFLVFCFPPKRLQMSLSFFSVFLLLLVRNRDNGGGLQLEKTEGGGKLSWWSSVSPSPFFKS